MTHRSAFACRAMAPVLAAGLILGASAALAQPVRSEARMPDSPSAAASAPERRAEQAEALLDAARRGDLARATELLRAGVPVDVSDAQGNTPLLLATAANQVQMARWLMAQGADVNRQNAMQDSAYLLAGAQGRLEILQHALAHGADLNSTNRFGGTALIPACERGHVETVRVLLAAGVRVDHVNRLGWTCLLEAVILSDGGPRHQAIAQAVIAAGADVNLADKDGVTPLAHALAKGQTEMARLLRAAGGR